MIHPMDLRAELDHRRPLDDVDGRVVALGAADEAVSEEVTHALRYVVGLARMTLVRDAHGADVDVREAVAPLARTVRERLARHLDDGIWPAVRLLPALVEQAAEAQRRLLRHHGVSPERLAREAGHRKLGLVLGGGGGAGYGYAGIFTLLERNGIRPSLLCGTSIGALAVIFRGRRLHHDPAVVLEAGRRLNWASVFSVGSEPSRYGLPATLRLHLRSAVGELFKRADGEQLQVGDLPIPTHVVATGLTVDALKHELAYYEHFLDDVVRAGQRGLVWRSSRLGKLTQLARVSVELASTPGALREVVFGLDDLTRQVDAVDAAGFSAAVPGLIHYDVLRDDQRTRHLMDDLYARWGITRLTEGGLVNNLPARVAFQSVAAGTLDGHRNVHIVAVDCFPPRLRDLFWYPLQQIARANVVGNLPYAHLAVQLSRTLSPMNLVPSLEDLAMAGEWARDDLAPHVDHLASVLTPVAVPRALRVHA